MIYVWQVRVGEWIVWDGRLYVRLPDAAWWPSPRFRDLDDELDGELEDLCPTYHCMVEPIGMAIPYSGEER